MRLKYQYDQLPTKSDKFNSHSIQDLIFFAKLDQFFTQKNKERTAVNCLLAKKLSPKNLQNSGLTDLNYRSSHIQTDVIAHYS